MTEEQTDHEKNHLFVAERLNKELCSILAGKIARKGGMSEIVKDVLDIRIRPDGSVMSTRKALKMVLETAKDIENINILGKQEYKLD